MTVSTKSQETQAKVLVGMQRRAGLAFTAASASHLGKMFGLSTAQVAASLKLLEDKGLVSRTYPKGSRGFGGARTRWYLTTAGLNAQVK
jgi:predicted ArsR family transcriptional regulator